MSGAILALFGVSLAATLGELLLPGDEGKGTKRFLKILVSLAVLLLLLRPFLSFLGSAEGFFKGEVGEITTTDADYGKVLNDAVARRSKAELEAGLYDVLKQQFEIQREDARVTVSLERDGTLRHVSVVLSGKALLTDPDKVKAAIVELLGCEVEVR